MISRYVIPFSLPLSAMAAAAHAEPTPPPPGGAGDTCGFVRDSEFQHDRCRCSRDWGGGDRTASQGQRDARVQRI